MVTIKMSYAQSHTENGYPIRPKQPIAITWGKGIALVLSIATITVHILSGFHTIFFFCANVICVVLAFVSLCGPFVMTPNFRRADLISHGFCAVLLFVSAVIFLIEVFKFKGMFKYNYTSLPIPDSKWRVNSYEAISAGVLGVVQSLVHGILYLVVWLRN